MLKSFRALFEQVATGPARCSESEREHRLQLATAVLMIEIMHADSGAADTEQKLVTQLLQERFELTPVEVAQLLDLAQQAQHDAHDLHTFTSRLHAAFELPEKQRIMEMFWQVAYADGQLNDHEHHLMRKLGDLLHIPHAAFIGTKLKASVGRPD